MKHQPAWRFKRESESRQKQDGLSVFVAESVRLLSYQKMMKRIRDKHVCWMWMRLEQSHMKRHRCVLTTAFISSPAPSISINLDWLGEQGTKIEFGCRGFVCQTIYSAGVVFSPLFSFKHFVLILHRAAKRYDRRGRDCCEWGRICSYHGRCIWKTYS